MKKIMNIYAIRVKNIRFNKLKKVNHFKKSKLGNREQTNEKILSLIKIKDFKFKFKLIAFSGTKALVHGSSLNKYSYGSKPKSLSKRTIGFNTTKNKKILFHELRLLKKKLKKLNRFLFNIIKNKSLSFLYIYLKKKIAFLSVYAQAIKKNPKKINSTLSLTLKL
jgi:hypothetical protein